MLLATTKDGIYLTFSSLILLLHFFLLWIPKKSSQYRIHGHNPEELHSTLSKQKPPQKAVKWQYSPAFLKGLCASKYTNISLINRCCVKYNKQVYQILQDRRTVFWLPPALLSHTSNVLLKVQWESLIFSLELFFNLVERSWESISASFSGLRKKKKCKK